MHAALETDAYLPLPERPVQQGVAAGESIDSLREVVRVIRRGEQRLADRAARRYQRVPSERIASMFAGASPPARKMSMQVQCLPVILTGSWR